MGLVLAELEERYADRVPPITADLLNELYPLASKRSRSDEAFLEKARTITAELQKGSIKYMDTWRKMVSVSVRDIRKTFDRLHVSFDYWYGESDSSKYVPQLLQILSEKNLLVPSEGAQVVDVSCESDKAPVPPAIVIKSNGSEGYVTTDIATILQRQQDFKPAFYASVPYRTKGRSDSRFNRTDSSVFRNGERQGRKTF